jgi:ATP-dependent helicase HrpA
MDIEVPPPAPKDPEQSEEEARKLRRTTSGKLHQALLSGLLSTLGLLTENREYLGARNRKFVIHPGSGLAKKSPKWLMTFELIETSRLFARMVAKIDPAWI